MYAHIVWLKNVDNNDETFYVFKDKANAELFLEEVHTILDNRMLENIETDYCSVVFDDGSKQEVEELADHAVFMVQSE